MQQFECPPLLHLPLATSVHSLPPIPPLFTQSFRPPSPSTTCLIPRPSRTAMGQSDSDNDTSVDIPGQRPLMSTKRAPRRTSWSRFCLTSGPRLVLLTLLLLSLLVAFAFVAREAVALQSAVAALRSEFAVHQQVAMTTKNWRYSLLPASAPEPLLHDYPHARTATATLISLDPTFCLIGYFLAAQMRALDPELEHDILIIYSTAADTSLFDTDPHCSAIRRLSLIPRRRRRLASGHEYSEGGLRLIAVESILPAMDAKGLKPQHDNWVYAMNKLRIFAWTDYDGILFMDADAFPMRPLHRFFLLPFDVSLGYDQYWGCHERVELISAVFFFRPSRHLQLAVMEFLDPDFQVPCAQQHLPTADQSVLNCICGTARAEWRHWPGDLSCGELPWYTQVQPQLMARQCPEFNASDAYILHYGGPPKPWTDWTKEEEHKHCGAVAEHATTCQSAEWFLTPERVQCFQAQAAMFSYWLCQRAKLQPQLERLSSSSPGQRMEDAADDPCPCALHMVPVPK